MKTIRNVVFMAMVSVWFLSSPAHLRASTCDDYWDGTGYCSGCSYDVANCNGEVALYYFGCLNLGCDPCSSYCSQLSSLCDGGTWSAYYSFCSNFDTYVDGYCACYRTS